MPINSFIHGPRLKCLTFKGVVSLDVISKEMPRGAALLGGISHLLGALAFDDVKSIFRTYADLGSAAAECYREFL